MAHEGIVSLMTMDNLENIPVAASGVTGGDDNGVRLGHKCAILAAIPLGRGQNPHQLDHNLM